MVTSAARTDPDCLFCKVVAGEVPGDVVAESDGALALRDIDPQAPTHVLVVPREHHADAATVAAADPAVLVEMVRLAARVAEGEGLESSYRLVFNTGAGAGQSVFHAHLHVLGGRTMTWPPG